MKIESTLRVAAETSDPVLCRAMWQTIMYDKTICDANMKRAERESVYGKPISWKWGTELSKISFDEFKERYDSIVETYDTMLSEKCLEYEKLRDLMIRLWNFWSVQIPNNFSFGTKCYDNRVDYTDIFWTIKKVYKADENLKGAIASMPKVEF